MGALYIGIIMLCRIAQHLSDKKTSNEINSTVTFIHYGAFRQLLSAALGVIVIIAAGNGFRVDLPTAAIGIFSGFMLLASMGLGIMALKSGTIALSSLFGTAGLLVPCIAGIYLFDQPMSVGQWCGVGLFFVGAYFLIVSSGEIYNGFSIKNLILLIGVMLTNGATMLSQQMFSHYVPKGDVSVFSLFSFGVVGIVLLAVLFPVSKRKGEPVKRLSKKLLGYGAVLSAAVFVINQLATLATAIVEPAVLFTFINGGSTIIAAIIGALCFNERLTKKSVAGVIIGVAALVLIKAL